MNVNMLTMVTVLYACCFINFDGLISKYNVKHCREVTGAGVPLDLIYLKHLGAESLPALMWLEDRLEVGQFKFSVLSIQRQLEEELKDQLGDWRGWTLRRHFLLKIIALEK